MKEKYGDECRQLEQNALYTAQAHHISAARFRHAAFWLQAVPAVIAAVTGALVGAGVSPSGLLWFTVLASAITAVTSVMNPSKECEDHSRAAKSFTALRHDARFLHEAQIHRLSDDDFARAVERLHERYNDLVDVAPTTGRSAFDKARKMIQGGIHEPDKNADGSIK